MRNASSPSLLAPIAMVVIVTAFLATALLNVGQSASNAQTDNRVALIEASAHQG